MRTSARVARRQAPGHAPRGRGGRKRLAALLAAAALALPAGAAAELPPLYHAEGMDSWDFWYAQSRDTTYAFYLQSPRDAEMRFTFPTVGLATSTDLIHWTEVGEVLRARPPGQWNDLWIATGSVWPMNGRWYMLFTGQSQTPYQGVTRGLGLAVSDDLRRWTRVGEGPVQLIRRMFVVPASSYWQSRGYAPGQRLSYTVLADPYVLPEPIDGWFYMVVNALVDGAALEERGCIGMFRSRDGLVWDDVGIVAHAKIFDQMEAPQLWQRGNRWYLEFGAARANPLYRATMVYVAPTLFGPFEPSPNPELKLPGHSGWFYVAKVVTGPDGRDVLLGNVGGMLSRPYAVTYEADGSLTLTTMDARTARWLPAGLAGHPGPLVPDLSGGVIAGGASRVNEHGVPLWGGTPGMTAAAWVSDGLGGAIGADLAGGEVRVTRVSVAGAPLWGAGAVVGRGAAGNGPPALAQDGAGGAFLAWIDDRGGGDDVVVQHVGASGRATWAPEGVVACVAGGRQDGATLVADGAGGVIVAWQDARATAGGGADVYAQRLDAAGVAAWAPDGIPVGVGPGRQDAPAIVSDGAGGAIVAWVDARDGAPRVYVQRLSAGGAPSWRAGGVAVASGAGDQVAPVMASDGAGGAFLAWEDHRAAGGAGDIYAQRLRTGGEWAWAEGGVPVCAEPHAQARPSIVRLPGAEAGVAIGWRDARQATEPSRLVTPYVQRLSPDGQPRWTADGVRVEPGEGAAPAGAPSMAADAAGGVYVAGTAGLQRVLPDGRPAWMPGFTPSLRAIEDVPDDEGGFVRLTVEPAASEAVGYEPRVAEYEVWRQSDATRPGSEPFPAGWEAVKRFAPAASAPYTVVAPTRRAATADDAAEERFLVAARTGGPVLLLPSTAVSAASTDNLAPAPPEGLVGSRIGGSRLRLAWRPNAEPDLSHYHVYRGPGPELAEVAESRVARTVALAWEDDAPASDAYHLVTAVDRHGNESEAATLSPGEIGIGPAPAVSYLARPAPNPAPGDVPIEFGLAEAGRVSLAVYDLAGRRLRALVDGAVTAGVQHVVWDRTDEQGRRLRAGIYLVRLSAPGIDRARKIVVAN